MIVSKALLKRGRHFSKHAPFRCPLVLPMYKGDKIWLLRKNNYVSYILSHWPYVVVYYLFCIVQHLAIAELKAKQLIEHKTIKDKSDFILTHTPNSLLFFIASVQVIKSSKSRVNKLIICNEGTITALAHCLTHGITYIQRLATVKLINCQIRRTILTKCFFLFVKDIMMPTCESQTFTQAGDIFISYHQ